MKTLVTLLLLTLVAVAHSQVVVLDDSNYTSFIQEHPYVFVKFYAPWCGHCKSMAPAYEQLAKEAEGKEYVIAHVDATVSPKVAEEAKVDGYPTLKLIVQGLAIDYNDERSFDAMKKWLDEMMAKDVPDISEEKVKELIGSTTFLLIQGATDDQMQLLRFAQSDGSIDFYQLKGGDPKITLYLKNSKTLDYTGELKPGPLSAWTLENTIGSLIPLSNNDYIKHVFEKNKIPSFMLLKNKDWNDELNELLESFCDENKEKFLCAWAGESHDIYEGVSRFLKAEGNEKSHLVFLDYGIKNGWRVPEPASITKESLAKFVEDVEAGKIEKFHDENKEKEAKEKNNNQKKIEYNAVRQLTEDTYNETLSSNDYVFVEYYSPTCGHCVQFAPEYEKLAERFNVSDSKYVIAAVNMVQEQAINNWVSINGYPTLRFYVKGDEFDYEGQRDGEEIIAFMEKVISSKLATIKSADEIPRPSVLVHGISADSTLQRLAHKFDKLPIYWVEDSTEEFKVEIHDNKFSQYKGDQNIDAVGNWLWEKTEEVLIDVAVSSNSKKLSRSLEEKIPLLILINRDDSEAVISARKMLEGFCEDKLEYFCAKAHKDDKQYKPFNDWVQDSDNEKSRLLFLSTENFEKFLYEGDLATLNEAAVEKFVKDVKDKKIKAYVPEPPKEEEEEKVEAKPDVTEQKAEEKQAEGEKLETGETVTEQAPKDEAPEQL